MIKVEGHANNRSFPGDTKKREHSGKNGNVGRSGSSDGREEGRVVWRRVVVS